MNTIEQGTYSGGVFTPTLFLGGESYGTWRVNGTTEILTKRGIKVSGVILISGGVPGSLMPGSFQDAMYVPARTAAAFELKLFELHVQGFVVHEQYL